MKYKALYRESRPEVFSEILGQDSIVRILKHQIETDTVSHAYLFTGTRGTGKTTTARVLAKAVNCLEPETTGRPCGKCANCKAIADGSFVDVIEIDAASNNGVDNIRELRESVNYPPAVGKTKVYIIDEVHMLSTGAFNALLKTLEEPPENVVFILATTNPEKLPQTVLSRCMRLDFKRVPQRIIAEHMRDICASKGVEINDDALGLLASNADGSVRDSLSILEQCISSGEKVLTRDIALDFLGAVSEEFFVDLTDEVMGGALDKALVLLDEALKEGRDVKQIMKDWMGHLRNLLITKYVKDPEDMLNMSTENIARLREQSSKLELKDINRAIITLAKAINDARYSTQARVLLEVAMVSISQGLSYSDAEGGSSGDLPGRAAPSKPSAPARPQAPKPSIEAEPEPAPAEAPAEEQAAAPDLSDDEFQGIWQDVCRDAAEAVPVLNILFSMMPRAPRGGELKLVTGLSMQKDMIEKNLGVIQEKLKKYGVGARVICALDEGGAQVSLMDAEPESEGWDDAPDIGSEIIHGADVSADGGPGNGPSMNGAPKAKEEQPKIDDRIKEVQKNASDVLGVEVKLK